MASDPISCLIFDCDGVLVDSESIAARIAADCFSEAGFPISMEELLSRFAGLSGEKVTQAVALQCGKEPAPGITESRRLRIMEALRSELRPVAGVQAALGALEHPKCVASSSHPERVSLALSVTGLAPHFANRVFTSSLVKRGKPAPDLFLFAAEKMGFRPQECLVIEDSVAGVQAGNAAGMRVVGFCGASHCRPGHAERLRSEGADWVLSEMREIVALIAERSFLNGFPLPQ